MAEFAGKTKVVFVGNLPYDATEQEVQKVFEVAGPVRSFRHVFDRDNNKAKGFGFCEYYDVDTAASAVRNLNGVAEVRGRLLRVDFAQPDIKDMPKDQRGARDKFGLPPLPPGVILPPGVNPAEQVHNKLSNIPPDQLLDILHQMKGLTVNAPEQARALLSQNPQLCYALFQSMLMLNLVDPSVLQRMIVPGSSGSNNVPPPMNASNLQGAQHGGPPPQFGGPQQQGPPPGGVAPGGPYGAPQQQPPRGYNQPPSQYGGPPGPGGAMPPQQGGGQPGGYPPMPGNFPMPPNQQSGSGTPQQQPPYGQQPGNFHAPAPSFPGMPYQAQQQQGYGGPPRTGAYGTPPPGQQQPPAGPPQQPLPATANPEQQALLQQVLSMTQQQIDLLPPDQRQTVMAIRNSARR
ncbi:hypothetical protein P389DRAFT_171631 [Cystobasidium minutum MCA 4210]|uniref:uncharacterized protein n=1 Tax=Cystobasidium minutum MCA 4210 TaxID=1397322 RepID=UPI0034CD1E45|eukprot:jgi/Rhomi1/171631/fgenesh1_kg.4_\